MCAYVLYFPSSCCSVACMGGAKQDWEAIGCYSHTLPTMEKKERRPQGCWHTVLKAPLFYNLTRTQKALSDTVPVCNLLLHTKCVSYQ